jgi:hypothetical protein
MLAVPVPEVMTNIADDAGIPASITACAPPLDAGQCVLYIDLGNATAMPWDAGAVAEVLQIPMMAPDIPVQVASDNGSTCTVHFGWPLGSCNGSLPVVSFTLETVQVILSLEAGAGGQLPVLGCDEAVPYAVGSAQGPMATSSPMCGPLCIAGPNGGTQIQYFAAGALNYPIINAITAAIQNRSCLYQ